MNYFKPISISLSPNVEKDDVKLALDLIMRPWFWKRGKAIKELEDEFKKYLGAKYAFSVNSGRSSLYAILKTLELEKGSEVLLQAFTCNAVPNPILWAGLEPIYADCDKDNFNIDIEDLKAKISPKTKAVIIQHTFGLPANMDEIKRVCEVNNLILIEDCAHSLGAEFKGQKVGTFGKAAFFSFSRDKVISSVYGGVAVTNDEKIGEALRQAQGKMGFPNPFWIFQQIFHPIFLNYIILPIYNFLDLGKMFLVLSQWIHILSKAVSSKEKKGQRPDYFPKALPNAMATMAYNQFGKLEKFEAARKNLFNFYIENLKNCPFALPQMPASPSQGGQAGVKQSYLRFTIKHKDAQEIIYDAWHKQNILLGDWYTTPIAPFDTKIEKMHYKTGMCPTAERLAKITLNLPTHINISKKDADRIINFLKKY